MTDNHLLLYRLAELMLEHEQHILRVDLLFDDDQIGEFVRSIQVESPYQLMIFEGVLTESVRDESLYVSYTVEGYFHFVLGEVIYNLSNGRDVEFLKQIVKKNRLNGAKEGVEECLIRDTQNNDSFHLTCQLIDAGDPYMTICIKPLISFLRRFGVHETIEKVLQNPSANYRKAFLLLDNFLGELQLIKIQKELRQATLNKNQFDNRDALELGIRALNSLEATHRQDFQPIIEKRLKDFPNDDDILGAWAFFQLQNDKYEQALEFFELALSIRLVTYGKEHAKVAAIYNNIGTIWSRKKEFDKALEYYQKSLESKLKTHGEEHHSAALSYGNIGSAWKGKGEYDKALEFYQRSLSIRLKSLGAFHLKVASSYSNIGTIWKRKDEFDRALECYKKALDIRLNTLGQEHLKVAKLLNNLGSVWQQKKEFVSALEYHERSLAIKIKIQGPEHKDVAVSYFNIGCTLESMEEYERSLENYQISLDIKQKSLGMNHPDVLKLESTIERVRAFI